MFQHAIFSPLEPLEVGVYLSVFEVARPRLVDARCPRLANWGEKETSFG